MPTVTFGATIIDWQLPASHDYNLAGRQLHIWRLHIPSVAARLAEAKQLLTPQECARAERYYHEKDRIRFALTRASVRKILAGYIRTSAGSIEICIGLNKKPFIKNHLIQYNVSHTDEWALIAISPATVGIDVERADPEFNYKEIAGTYFNKTEASQLLTEKDTRLFYAWWTRKEALLKATGKGIDEDIAHLPSADGNHMVPAPVLGSTEDWTVQSFDLDSSHVASVAHSPATNITAALDADNLWLPADSHNYSSLNIKTY